MIVLFHSYQKDNHEAHHTLYDTLTNSVIRSNTNLLKHMLEEGLEIDNVKFEAGAIRIKRLNHGGNMLMACKNADSTYRIIDSDGYIKTLNKKDVTKLVMDNKISNCRINANKKLETAWVDKIQQDTNFEEYIKTEYNKYISKNKLLGNRVSFNYIVENHEVILKTYTGESKDIILPNFITVIGTCAFSLSKMDSIKLNNGLKVIGTFAMADCKLSEIVIPETVEVIHNGAFNNCKGLQDSEHKFDRNKLKLMSDKTILI